LFDQLANGFILFGRSEERTEEIKSEESRDNREESRDNRGDVKIFSKERKKERRKSYREG